MPQVAIPALIAGVASVGATAIVSGIAAVTLATFAVPTLITLGVGLIARAFAPKIRTPGLSPPSNRAAQEQAISEAIAPVRWVPGTQRVRGRFVWGHVNDRDFHACFCLSALPCEGITQIWINGEQKTLSISTTSDGTRRFYYLDDVGGSGEIVFECYEYFRGDGTQGAESFAAAVGADLSWTAEDVQGMGLSWVYCRFHQPDYGQKLESRTWPGIPSLEFVIEGIKVGYPISDTQDSTPEFTNNAAIIRAWWLVHRRGVARKRINRTYLNAAITRCDTLIDISNLPSYNGELMDEEIKRYTIDGLIHSGDPINQIEEAMDFAWDGAVVEWDGELLFRPGGQRPVTYEINEDDIVKEPQFRPGTGLTTNRYVAQLNQSEWHDYSPYTIQVDDRAKQQADGRVETADLGAIDFSINPAQTGNLLKSVAKRARAGATLELTISPGSNYEATTIIPGDKVTVNLAELYLSVQEFMVMRTAIQPGWGVQLTLVEWGADWYVDELTLDTFKPRQIVIVPDLVAPQDVVLIQTPIVNEDNTIVWRVDISLPTQPWGFHIRWKLDTETYWDHKLTNSTNEQVMLVRPGTYNFEIRSVGHDSRYSPPTLKTITTGYDTIIPAAPTLQSSEQYGTLLHCTFFSLKRYVEAIEIRYTDGELAGTDPLATITQTNWDQAKRLDSVTVTPPYSANVPIIVNAVIPQTRRYRLFARAITVAGKLSSIKEMGVFSLIIPAVETKNQILTATWPGTLNHLRVWPFTAPPLETNEYLNLWCDKVGTATGTGVAQLASITPDQWDGDEGWPFSRCEGYGLDFHATNSTYYIGEAYDLGAIRNCRVLVNPSLFEPSGTPDTGSYITEKKLRIGVYYGATNQRSQATYLEISDENDTEDNWTINRTTELNGVRYLWFRVHMYETRNIALKNVSMDVEITA